MAPSHIHQGHRASGDAAGRAARRRPGGGVTSCSVRRRFPESGGGPNRGPRPSPPRAPTRPTQARRGAGRAGPRQTAFLAALTTSSHAPLDTDSRAGGGRAAILRGSLSGEPLRRSTAKITAAPEPGRTRCSTSPASRRAGRCASQPTTQALGESAGAFRLWPWSARRCGWESTVPTPRPLWNRPRPLGEAGPDLNASISPSEGSIHLGLRWVGPGAELASRSTRHRHQPKRSCPRILRALPTAWPAPAHGARGLGHRPCPGAGGAAPAAERCAWKFIRGRARTSRSSSRRENEHLPRGTGASRQIGLPRISDGGALRWRTGCRAESGVHASSQPSLVADDNADMRDYVARLLFAALAGAAPWPTARRRWARPAKSERPDLVSAERDDAGIRQLQAAPRAAHRRGDPRHPVIMLSARAGERVDRGRRRRLPGQALGARPDRARLRPA